MAVSKKQSTGLATEKYQAHLKFIYSTSTPIRPYTSLTFCHCLILQNRKALARNLRIIFSVTCQKTTQKFLPQRKKYNEGKTRNIIYLVNKTGQFKFLDNEIKDPGQYGLCQYISKTFYSILLKTNKRLNEIYSTWWHIPKNFQGAEYIDQRDVRLYYYRFALMMMYGGTTHYITVTWYKLLFCTSNTIVYTFLWSTWYLTTPKF